MASVTTFSCAGQRGGGGVRAGSASGSDSVDTTGVRRVGAAPLGSLTIRKWRLENGLVIITVPDPGARSVSYVTTFRVGSRDENAAAGETGLAHLFEHLMFRGSAGVDGAADFDHRIEEVGGSSNAMTYYDFTAYVDDVPPDALARAVGLEAHRMVNLDLGAKQLASERDVVVQERLGSVEDSVDGLLDELMWNQAFRSHPYRWPVMGRMQDIKSVTRERALAFYRRHYAPDRAVVVIAGRFDEGLALRTVKDAYGSLPPGAASPLPEIAPERAPSAEVRQEIERPVAADRLLIGYPAPALGDADRPAYDLLVEVLVGGPSSRLYRLLVVERELASSVVGDVAPTRDPGLWSLWVQITRGHDAGEAEQLIGGELERAVATTVPAAELGAAKNRLETAFWQDLASSRGRAEALGQFEVTTGDFRTLIDRGAATARVTSDDLQRVARAYLAGRARSVVIAHPKNR